MPQDQIYDPAFVKGIFDRCSSRYIAFSYVCSFGFTERWRRQCVDALRLEPGGHYRGYDLMAGTGEIWPHLLRKYPQTERVVAVDISSGMHARAINRLHRMRLHQIDFIEDDVLVSQLPDESADFVVSTFGLKTFNALQLERLTQLTSRILKPGGRFAFIEASDPRGWILRPLYLLHLKVVLPMIERVFLRGADDFAMIGTYCLNFGDVSNFCGMLRANGLKAHFQKCFFGCATIASGKKAALS